MLVMFIYKYLLCLQADKTQIVIYVVPAFTLKTSPDIVQSYMMLHWVLMTTTSCEYLVHGTA